MLVARDDPGAPVRAPRETQAAAVQSTADLRLILEQLRSLLDESQDTRTSMRHLAFIEHALNRMGLRALSLLPVDMLRRALNQFELLVTNWSPVGLATLRSKMAVSIIDRSRAPVLLTAA